MLLMIDNYDSFTYNLVHYLGELGQDVKVFRNDRITVEDIENLQPDYIVISPGPCTPNEAGVSLDVVRTFAGQIPILGVCLGHQTIAQAFGADIIRAEQLMHGKTSKIHHDEQTVFSNVDNPLEATRYHSLIIDNKTLPEDFVVSAKTDADEIMAIRHKHLPIEGLQFHPESILTTSGKHLLNNFLSCYGGVIQT